MPAPALWDTEDDAILERNYPDNGLRYCMALLKTKSYKATRSRVARLKLRLNPGVSKRIQAEIHAARAGVTRIVVDAAIKAAVLDGGKTTQDVAEETAVEPWYIRNRCKHLGLTLQKKQQAIKSSSEPMRKIMETTLDETEKLALYGKWRSNYPREVREPCPR